MCRWRQLIPEQEAEAIRSAFGASSLPLLKPRRLPAEEPFFKGKVPVPAGKPAQPAPQEELMVASVAVPQPRPVLSDAAAPLMAEAAPAEEEAAPVEVALASPPKPCRQG